MFLAQVPALNAEGFLELAPSQAGRAGCFEKTSWSDLKSWGAVTREHRKQVSGAARALRGGGSLLQGREPAPGEGACSREATPQASELM